MIRGVELCFSCFDLVAAGLSDEEIADQLDYDLPDMQDLINRVRAKYASLRSRHGAKSSVEGQADPETSVAASSEGRSGTSTSTEQEES